MPIMIPTPITVPEKVFDKLWVAQVMISSPGPTQETMAEVVLTPYNEAGELLPEQSKVLSITSIMARATAFPESNIAKAMHFIIAAIEEEYQSSL
jgi:hypothetical protein